MLEDKENLLLSLSAFILFLVTRIAFKSSLDLYFHYLILEFFRLPSGGSESKDRYTLWLLLMWLAAVGEVGLEVAIPAVGRANDLPGRLGAGGNYALGRYLKAFFIL